MKSFQKRLNRQGRDGYGGGASPKTLAVTAVTHQPPGGRRAWLLAEASLHIRGD